MSPRPYDPATSPCFGVCCPKHSQCSRYAEIRIRGSHGAIATCVTATVIPQWPGFVLAELPPAEVNA